jgi:hypothetical protein
MDELAACPAGSYRICPGIPSAWNPRGMAFEHHYSLRDYLMPREGAIPFLPIKY